MIMKIFSFDIHNLHEAHFFQDGLILIHRRPWTLSILSCAGYILLG